jgi:hypothetical protein
MFDPQPNDFSLVELATCWAPAALDGTVIHLICLVWPLAQVAA